MQKHTDLFGHPSGLFYLFFAELWERFSFYGMRALLVLYMTKQLLFSDQMSFGIYAAYMSLVYFTPIIGGMLADHYLGYRRAIFMGGISMALGHFLLSIETPFFFFSSLALIIVGNGFFKPNISTFVGTLYGKEDRRRDAGFTIFYMGINIGGALAPLACAWLAELYGWHYGFMLAGIGMLIGLWFFYDGNKNGVFEDKGGLPNPSHFFRKNLGLNQGQWIVLATVFSLPFFALLLKYFMYEHYLVWAATIVIAVTLYFIVRSVDSLSRKKLMVTVYFTVLMTLFWAVFEQAGSSLTLFADRNVALIGMNAAQTNSINSFFIILLAIPFAQLWRKLDSVDSNPNSALKAGIGLLLLGLGFIIFGSSAQWVNVEARTPMLFLLLGYFVVTVGELFISPIGLSKMTELSPPKYLAFIMGVFFTSSFYGHFFAGKIANLTASSSGSIPFSTGILGTGVEWITGLSSTAYDVSNQSMVQLHSYVSVFSGFGILTLMIGLVVMTISPWVKKWMGEVH